MSLTLQLSKVLSLGPQVPTQRVAPWLSCQLSFGSSNHITIHISPPSTCWFPHLSPNEGVGNMNLSPFTQASNQPSYCCPETVRLCHPLLHSLHSSIKEILLSLPTPWHSWFEVTISIDLEFAIKTSNNPFIHKPQYWWPLAGWRNCYREQ